MNQVKLHSFCLGMLTLAAASGAAAQVPSESPPKLKEPIPAEPTPEEAAAAPSAGPTPSQKGEIDSASRTSEPATAPSPYPDTPSKPQRVLVKPPNSEKQDDSPESPPTRSTEPPEPPEPAEPMSRILHFAIIGDILRNRDPGWDYFSKDDGLERFGATLGADLLSFGAALSAGLQAGVLSSSFSDSGVLNYVNDARFSSTEVELAATLHYAANEYVQPYLRVGGGFSWVDAVLVTQNASAKTDERQPFGQGGLGMLLQTPARRLSRTRRHFNSLTVGLLVEGGYFYSPRIEMSLPSGTRSEEEGAPNVNVAPTPLGELERKGPYLRVGAVLSF